MLQFSVGMAGKKGQAPMTGGNRVASALAKARTAAGLSKVEIARRVGVDRVTVHRWENGEREPSMDQVLRWLDATHTPLAAFLSDTPPLTGSVTGVVEPLPHAFAAALDSLHPGDAALLRRIGLLFTVAADLALDRQAARTALSAATDAGTPRADDDQ